MGAEFDCLGLDCDEILNKGAGAGAEALAGVCAWGVTSLLCKQGSKEGGSYVLIWLKISRSRHLMIMEYNWRLNTGPVHLPRNNLSSRSFPVTLLSLHSTSCGWDLEAGWGWEGVVVDCWVGVSKLA